MIDYVIAEHDVWPQRLAQVVMERVGHADGPIMLFAEDYIGGAMATSVVFERNGNFTSVSWDELNEIALVVQDLYVQWGGSESDVRGVLFVIRDGEFSARLIYSNEIDPDTTNHDRFLRFTREVFGREWVPPPAVQQ